MKRRARRAAGGAASEAGAAGARASGVAVVLPPRAAVASCRAIARAPSGLASAIARASAIAMGVAIAAGSGVACRDARSAGGDGEAAWTYDVDAPVAPSRVVHVTASFVASRVPRLVIADPAAAAVRGAEIDDDDDGRGWRALRPAVGASGWSEAQCVRACRVRYAVDLDALVGACDGAADCAARAGDATLAPASTWLLHPAPKAQGTVTVRVHAAAPAEFATGLRPGDAAGTYAFRTHDLDEGAFTAFGPMRAVPVAVAGGALDVRVLGPAQMTDADVRAWIGDAAATVAALYGRFPVARATVFVLAVTSAPAPAPARADVDVDDDVVFGKVLALSGPSVAILAGAATTRDVARADWVTVHELFHLGFPSFRGEGRWLGEGMATYYESVLRARAGTIDERDVWRGFAAKLARGLPRPDHAVGLAERDDLDGIYWGGALFALLADVQIRERTGNARSLDDALRTVLDRGGDAAHVWSVAEVVRTADAATGTRVLAELADAMVARAGTVDVGALLSSLGVDVASDGDVVLRADRPLAALRASIFARR